MEAKKGELMVDPVDGGWWLWVYLGYAVVLGGAYALGAPGWQVALLIVMVLMVVIAWTRL